MKPLALAFLVLAVVPATAATSAVDERPLLATAANNPIRLEGQIREISATGDGLSIRLHRDRYPIITHDWTRVRWLDGRCTGPSDLQVGDNIRVEGVLERTYISADHVTILLRIERR